MQILIVLLMFVAAAAFLVAGVYMLTGLAWSLVAIGILLFGAAMALRAGMTPNG